MNSNLHLEQRQNSQTGFIKFNSKYRSGFYFRSGLPQGVYNQHSGVIRIDVAGTKLNNAGFVPAISCKYCAKIEIMGKDGEIVNMSIFMGNYVLARTTSRSCTRNAAYCRACKISSRSR